MAILIDERVVAIRSIGRGKAHVYGAGTVTAEEEPQRSWLAGTGITAMRIELDDGGVIWSNECHAIPEKNWNPAGIEVVTVDVSTLDREPINAG